MPRFLTTSFIILALAFGTAGVAPAVHAEPVDAPPPPDNANPYADLGNINPNTDFATQANLDTAAAGPLIQQASAAPTDGTKGTPDDAYNNIMMKIMSLFAWLVGAAMLTLNYAMYYTVVTMGAYVKNLDAVGTTWQILRDIGNIMLIFGFLAVGITTILNVDWYGGGKKMLPMMLVAAVFLNFSLFFTEAIIDTGNLFATQFYTQINGPLSSPDATLAQLSREGVSGKIMSQLGLAAIYGDAKKGDGKVLLGSNPWFVGFMGILLFIILAFVLFSLAFVLIARFIILLFLIILSPVAFAGLAVPGLNARMMAWWHKLFEQVLTAPILLLMLYIALKVITATNFLRGFNGGNAGSWTDITGDNIANFAGVLLSFLVAMGLLIAVVIQSKNLSAFGAAGASKLAGKLTFGATAFGMRSTLGWGAQGASQAIRRSRIGGTKFGRLAATTFDKGAKASFDIRGVKAFSDVKGIEAGKAQEGGYRKRREDAIKGHEEYVKSIGQAFDDKGATKAEEAAVVAAETTRANAEKKFDSAETLHKSVKDRLSPQITLQEEEVAKLKLKKKQEEDSSPNMTATQETEQKLKEAEKKLATSESILGASSTNLARAADSLKDAQEEETKANKKLGSEASAAKKVEQLGYAANISGPLRNTLPSWALFGPGGTAAARKIIKDTKKSPDKVLLDTLKKAIAAGEKEPTASTKPTAPTTAPSGGTPPKP